MTDAQHIDLLMPPPMASQGDLLAYIEQTRRKLDRYHRLHATINPLDAAAIRAMCDELEADILKNL